MDTQKLLSEIKDLEKEVNLEKNRCKPPFNREDTPIEQLRFFTYGSALVFFSRLRERVLKVHTLRKSLRVCT